MSAADKLHIVCWSGGKDSTATIVLAHEHGLPIDLIIICLVWFDKEREIYAESPEVVEWILNYAKPLFESWGYKVRKSTLRRYLNEEYIKNFDKADLLPLVSDLTTDSGQKDYGTSEDYIALLSCDLYRKYRETMPKYDTWVWTLTPWHISPSYANYARIVYTDGSLYNGGAYVSYGVAPACLFNPKIFE